MLCPTTTARPTTNCSVSATTSCAQSPIVQRPTIVARRENRTVSRTIWTRSANCEWRHLQVTAVPLVIDAERTVGVMHLCWEIDA